jgi:proline iminopeptidase
MRRLLTALLLSTLAFAAVAGEHNRPASYFDNTGREDAWQGGVRMVPIRTPAGDFRVWTKRVGNNPAIKVLILHGGPGSTHEAYEVFDSFLPAGGVEYYYYDQLGSAYSDQPADMAPLLSVDRFVDGLVSQPGLDTA